MGSRFPICLHIETMIYVKAYNFCLNNANEFIFGHKHNIHKINISFSASLMTSWRYLTSRILAKRSAEKLLTSAEMSANDANTYLFFIYSIVLALKWVVNQLFTITGSKVITVSVKHMFLTKILWGHHKKVPTSAK